MQTVTAKLFRGRRAAATWIVGLAIAIGAYVIWTSYVAPYLQIHALVTLQRDFRRTAHRADAFIFQPSGWTASKVVLIRQGKDTNGASLFQPLEHEIVILSAPSAEDAGDSSQGVMRGEVKIDKGAVWYEAKMLHLNPGALTNVKISQIKIVSCNIEQLTARITFVLNGKNESEHELKGISREEVARLRSTIKSKFAAEARGNFPVGVMKEFATSLDQVAGSAQITEKGDQNLSLVRQSEGASSGGATYILGYKSGHTEMVDAFSDESSAATARRFAIVDKKRFDVSSGWHDIQILPASKRFKGDYLYVVDKIGVEYALQSDAPHPTIADVVAFSPASRAGINKGDGVLRINGQSTARLSLAELYGLTEAARPTVRLEVYRFALWGLGNATVRTYAVQREPQTKRVHVDCLLTPRLTSQTVMPRQTAATATEFPKTSLDEKAAEQFIRQYFAAASSGSGQLRDSSLAQRVFFYESWKTLEEARQRFRTQEKALPFRLFSVSSISLRAIDARSFDATVHVKHSLGQNAETAKANESDYYIRLEGSSTGFLITRLSEDPIPGWKVAEYKTRISPLDFRQSQPGGKLFSELRWNDHFEMIREIVLQDRANFEKGRTKDHEDEPCEYFKQGIAKTRDEWVKNNVTIKFEGNTEELLSGDALIAVKVYKNEQVLVQILDRVSE